MAARPLVLQNAIGYNGKVSGGLLLHESEDAAHVIYTLGSTIVIRNVEDAKDQAFLRAHTQAVRCLAMSRDKTKMASGQINHMGFCADVIVWDITDIKEPRLQHKLSLHKVEVLAVAFSCDGNYIASIGGQDDNNMVIWDTNTGMAICGSPASHDSSLVVTWHESDPLQLVTGGMAQLRLWSFSPTDRKVRPQDVFTGKERRSFTSLAFAPPDDRGLQFLYAGTTSGDIMKIDMRSNKMVNSGPRKRFQQGVTSLVYNPVAQELLVGSGAGELAVLETETLAPKSFTSVMGGVSAVALDGHGEFFFAGTAESNLYLVQYTGLVAELKGTSHSGPISDVVFPNAYAELFATCGGSDIRVWHAKSLSELLRIQVPNIAVNAIAFPQNGTTLLSGWSDGKIRAFGPQSGNLQYVINDAHRTVGLGNSSGGTVQINGVTAVASTHDCRKLVSGGADGKVRVWAVSKAQQVMLASMQEHKGPIFSIAVNSVDTQCVSSSADGSCIVWSLGGLSPYTRIGAIYAPNFFKSAIYLPDESQLLTCGTDRKISYWDATDLSEIRQIEGSDAAEMTALHISQDGGFFASGSADREVKLWHYNKGALCYVGAAHSGAVTALKISPDEKTIVSVGTEGGINIWTVPTDVAHFASE